MQNVDSTVIATALPAMARDFGADPVRMNVALTAYLLSLAACIPASGWIADRFGARDVFRAAIALFTIASVLCGRAESLPFLIAARVLQGVGGALMVPVGRLLLLRTVRKQDLVAATAWLSAPALLGPILGPPLGGFLTTALSWRWVFDINVPLGILGIALATRCVPAVAEPGPGRFDAAGFTLIGCGLAAFMLAQETIGRGVLPVWAQFAAAACAVSCAALYLRHAAKHAAPVIDLSLMRIRTFMVSVVAGSFFRIGVGAMPFLLPLLLQVGFGQSALQSGLTTFAGSAGALVMKPAAIRALRWFGFRNTLAGNGILAAATLGACATFRPDWPLWAIYMVLLVGGFLRSLQFTAYNTLAFADLPHDRLSAATSLYSTLQQVSLTSGVSLGAGALEISMTFSGQLTPGPIDFAMAFALVSSLSLIAAPLSLLMPRDAGAELSGQRRRSPARLRVPRDTARPSRSP